MRVPASPAGIGARRWSGAPWTADQAIVVPAQPVIAGSREPTIAGVPKERIALAVETVRARARQP
jgi:hypothetical protein